jgi:hypothetical protein
MRTFENLIGDTDTYVRGDEVGIKLRRLKKIARKGGRLARRSTSLALKAEPHVLTARATKLAAKGLGKGLAAVTGPVRRRIFRAFFKKLISRRARLISWQQRRSLRPLPAEQRQAQSWATAYVRRKGILGKLVGAALSGDVAGQRDLVGEPATAALVAASIPLLIKLAQRALKTAEKEGAPAEPQDASNTAQPEPQVASNTAPAEPQASSDQEPAGAPADDED